MASNTYFSSDAYKRHSGQSLHRKVSNISETSDMPSTLRGRESLVSLLSVSESPTQHSPREPGPEQQWYRGLRDNVRYQPVISPSPAGVGRFKSFRARMQETILEDENVNIDMSILRSTIPSSADIRSGPYSAVPKEEPVFDMTSFAGPMMGVQDEEEFLNSLREQQEASGRVSEGEAPGTEVQGDQLASPTRSTARPLSMRRSASNLRESWQSIEEAEATRREVIEAVTSAEEPAHVDPNSTTGPPPVHDEVPLPPKNQLFDPKPNWKPLFMRWPYLLFLIILSVALGIAQELVYQTSTHYDGLVHLTNSQDFNPGLYSALKFIPTVITVIYGVLWQNTNSQVRRLEAFYQMSREGGALAAESIHVDYMASYTFLRLLFVSFKDHYPVAISSLATFLAVSLVPILGSATLLLTPSNPHEIKAVTVNAIVSRLLTITFFVIALLGCALFYDQLMTRRRSGLVSDIKGITGLASIAVSRTLMAEFKDMDTAKPSSLHYRLKNRRYELRNGAIFSEEELLPNDTDKFNRTYLSENPHPWILRKSGFGLIMVGLISLGAILPVVLFTPADKVVYSAPWVITVLTVYVKWIWGEMDINVRILEPYHILAKRHAPASTLILDYSAMPFGGVAVVRALLNRHWIVFLVTLGTVLVDVLIIFATSLVQVGGSDLVDLKGLTTGSLAATTFATLAITGLILVYLFIVALVVFICRRRPFLPRQPHTMASVLAFLHQSKMLYSFIGTSRFSEAEMIEKVNELHGAGKTYGLGWLNGRDGLMHCGIDEEELMTGYKHGIGDGAVS